MQQDGPPRYIVAPTWSTQLPSTSAAASAQYAPAESAFLRPTLPSTSNERSSLLLGRHLSVPGSGAAFSAPLGLEPACHPASTGNEAGLLQQEQQQQQELTRVALEAAKEPARQASTANELLLQQATALQDVNSNVLSASGGDEQHIPWEPLSASRSSGSGVICVVFASLRALNSSSQLTERLPASLAPAFSLLQTRRGASHVHQ